jgi:predicted nucleotidyltransferase
MILEILRGVIFMSVIGIIAEYNPFHNGHAYHLQESLRLCGGEAAVCIMSGDFLQRGIPAIADKYSRAYAACTMGIDAVFELPVLFATGSASDFAMGAVSMLNRMHTIDCLCFGAEAENLNMLEQIASLLAKEPSDFSSVLKDSLKAGHSYPKARELAILECLGPEAAPYISTPNNILAIEYLIALQKLDSSIRPLLIRRKDAMYHDSSLQRSISSATAIREALLTKQNISQALPKPVQDVLKPFLTSDFPTPDDFSLLLSALLYELQECPEEAGILDLTNDMTNRLRKLTLPATYTEIANSLKNKSLTMTRVSRALLHLLLGITTAERKQIIEKGYSHYANLLAFRRDTPVLRRIKDRGDIPVITKKADFLPSDQAAKLLYSYDRKAVMLYNQVLYEKCGISLPNEYSSNVRIFSP